MGSNKKKDEKSNAARKRHSYLALKNNIRNIKHYYQNSNNLWVFHAFLKKKISRFINSVRKLWEAADQITQVEFLEKKHEIAKCQKPPQVNKRGVALTQTETGAVPNETLPL